MNDSWYNSSYLAWRKDGEKPHEFNKLHNARKLVRSWGRGSIMKVTEERMPVYVLHYNPKDGQFYKGPSMYALAPGEGRREREAENGTEENNAQV